MPGDKMDRRFSWTGQVHIYVPFVCSLGLYANAMIRLYDMRNKVFLHFFYSPHSNILRDISGGNI